MYATHVAAQMVGAAGMTDTLVSYSAVQNSGFSDTNLVGRVLGDSEGRRRVEEMLQRQKIVVRGLLDTNQHLVAALRDALLERHELIGREITDVLEAGGGRRAARRTPIGERTIDLRTTDAAGQRGRVASAGCAPLRAVPCCLPCCALLGCPPRSPAWRGRARARSRTRLVRPGCRSGCCWRLALSAAVFVTCGLLLGRPGAAAAAIGWLGAVLLMSSRRPEGDLVVPATATGYAWLLVGTLLAGVCVALPYSSGRGRPMIRP